MFIQLLAFLVQLASSIAQNPCDDPYGQYCPESSGWDVGQCLQDLDGSVKQDFSKDCKVFIDLHNHCEDDIEKYCIGKEYTGDLLPCLVEWTPIESVSEVCVNAFPKKVEPVSNSGKDSKKAKKNAEKRRRIRNKAAKMARKDL